MNHLLPIYLADRIPPASIANSDSASDRARLGECQGASTRGCDAQRKSLDVVLPKQAKTAISLAPSDISTIIVVHVDTIVFLFDREAEHVRITLWCGNAGRLARSRASSRCKTSLTSTAPRSSRCWEIKRQLIEITQGARAVSVITSYVGVGGGPLRSQNGSAVKFVYNPSTHSYTFVQGYDAKGNALDRQGNKVGNINTSGSGSGAASEIGRAHV